MRASVAERGTAGSTFDQVARAAGVSRGLLHYYFGTKERLLIEVVRRDCDVRQAALAPALAQAGTADDVIAVLVASLEDVVRNDPGFVTLIFELFVLSRRHEDVAAEFGELLSRLRRQVAGVLRDKQHAGRARPGSRARGGGRRHLLARRRDGAADARRRRARLRSGDRGRRAVRSGAACAARV